METVLEFLTTQQLIFERAVEAKHEKLEDGAR